MLIPQFLPCFLIRFDIEVDVDRAELGRHLLVQLAVDEVVELLGEWLLPMILLFCQIETNDVAAVLCKESCKVTLCAQAARIFRLVYDDVWLWGKRARRLRPEEWERCPQLHIRAKYRMAIRKGRVGVHLKDLLSFDMIGAKAQIADASLQVTRAGVVARPAADQDYGAALVHVLEVQLTDVAVYERYDPQLAVHKFVEILNVVLVPHEH